MKIKDLGEFGLIDRFSPAFKDLVPGKATGIGDDCAVIPLDYDNSMLVSTDLLVENVHFLRDSINPFQLGYKSLAVNLSDLAAMGGTPHSTYLSLALPQNVELDWVDSFFEGYKHLSHKENVALLGGDTTKSPDKIVINVTVLGNCNTDRIKFRNSAKVGDYICLTGVTGESGAGLKVILDKLQKNELNLHMLKKHLEPVPQVEEGKFLSNFKAVNAMLDVSDGVNSDIKHILKASNKGATIYVDDLPITDSLKRFCSNNNYNADELALTAGEDYTLMFTVEESFYEELSISFYKEFNRHIYKIGVINSNQNEIDYIKNGIPFHLENKGYSHFSQNTLTVDTI